MKFEFVPTGDVVRGYLWKGFDHNHVIDDKIKPYDTHLHRDGLALCTICNRFKQNHGLINIGLEEYAILCPETYVMTAPTGCRMLIRAGDEFFTRNFKILSTEFENPGVRLVADGGELVP